MNNIKVSVCIAYYNRSEYIEDCIRSILEQTYSDLEVVVVNDGSTDLNTKNILDSITDPRLKVIHQKNTGFVGAIRNAIDNSSGEYIAIQGAGDVSLPERIEEQVNVLDEKPEVGIVSCFFENVVFGGPDNGNRRKRPYKNTRISANDFLSGLNPIGHGEVMFRRSIYDKVGGYRHFFRFSQDLDLWLRMVDHCKVHIIEEYLYERRMFIKDGVSTDVKKQFLQKYLAEFARQNYKERQKSGQDLIDIYGNQAGLFKDPSKELSRYAAIKGLQSYKNQQYDNARYYLGMSKKEPFTKAKMLLMVVDKLYQTDPFQPLAKLILGKIDPY